jgi:leucyl aminopeptidase
MHHSLVRRAQGAVKLYALSEKEFPRFLESLPVRERAFLVSAGFSARDYELQFLPGATGSLSGAVLGLGKAQDPLALARFAEKLPPGTYQLVQQPFAPDMAVLGWLYGTYAFTRYKHNGLKPKLVLPAGADGAAISRIAEAVFLARDLINTPANHMGPEDLAKAARALAKSHNAKIAEIAGEALVRKNYPLIHAVGRGSARQPRLIDLTWGRANTPKLTLVGKGVSFDSGGYDLKSSSGMFTMKKDMGGAAVCLALAKLIMEAHLKVRLRVLIPAVENLVSGSAYRPSDIVTSRKGLSVEIGNTDAEGRLVLADALTEADSESPDLLIDLATLTGAARIATGMELPPFFTDDEKLAAELMSAAAAVHDPLWRLPLWRGYESALSSSVADLTNMPDYGYAGAITAALFLNRFVTGAKSWVHFDIAAWTDRPKPGRPRGAEATATRAIFRLLQQRYG